MKRQKSAKQKYKRNNVLKSKIEWIVLIILILIVPIAIWANLFTYTYYFFKCEDRPAEVFGNYYRIPYDKGYGIHPGSDYSNCSWSPPGKIRDPSTVAGMAQNNISPKSDHDLYVPGGYEFTQPSTHPQGNGTETNFDITTKSGVTFRVRELNKNSDFSYTNLCSKPTEGSWSGTIIGNDDEGRAICRTNLSKYIKDYIVGINKGRTAIILQAPISSEELLNSEAIAIFSSMEPYKTR